MAKILVLCEWKVQDMRKAFTLIELLVVIAIIAILAAILFPVFAQAKESAKQVVCMSNMKQLCTASIIYMGDCDDVWFPALTYDDIGPGWAPQRPWLGYDNNNAYNVGATGDVRLPATHPIRVGIIDPYLKSEGIKKCPNTPSGWQTSYAVNMFYPRTDSAFYASHPEAANNEFAPSARELTMINGLWSLRGASGSEVEEPAETLQFWEHDASVPVCNFAEVLDWTTNVPAPLVEHFHFLHRAGSNTGWADGHARRMAGLALNRRMFTCRKDLY